MTHWKQPVSPLTNRTSAPTRTWPSRVSARTTDCQTDVLYESFRGHSISPPSQRHGDSRFLPTVIRWSTGTFTRLIGSEFAFLRVNPLRDCHLWTHQTSRRQTKIFARAWYLQPNSISHLAVTRTMCHAVTESAKPSITSSSDLHWGLIPIEPLHPYYLG